MLRKQHIHNKWIQYVRINAFTPRTQSLENCHHGDYIISLFPLDKPILLSAISLTLTLIIDPMYMNAQPTSPRKFMTPASVVTLLLLYCPPLSDNRAPGSGTFFSSNTCKINAGCQVIGRLKNIGL